MTFDDLQNAWNSPGNHFSRDQQRALAEQFNRQQERRRRFQRYWLIHTFVWLTLITGLAVAMSVSGRTDLTQEWALLPLLLVPWAFALRQLRRYRKHAAPSREIDATLHRSLVSALDSIRDAQTQTKGVALLFAVLCPVLAVAIHQLHLAGKTSAREMTSMAVFFGATLLVGGAALAVRYFARLRPQQRQVEELLGQLEEPPIL